jgi:hypothetical protein
MRMMMQNMTKYSGLFLSLLVTIPLLGNCQARGNATTVQISDKSNNLETSMTCESMQVRVQPSSNASGYGILRSTDNGQTWKQVINDSAEINDIVETNDGHILAATGSQGGNKEIAGLLQSLDDGENWTRTTHCTNGADLTIIRAILPVEDRKIIATGGLGAWRSNDGGDTWTAMSYGAEHSNLQAAVETTIGGIFAAAYDGLFQWNNDSSTWIRTGPRRTSFNDLVTTSKGTVIAASGGKGIYRSANSGVLWTQIMPVPGRVWVSKLASDSKGHLFAGIADHGVYRSEDDGMTWKKLHIVATDPQTYALAVGSHGEVFAAIANCCPVYSVELLRSMDAGISWSSILKISGGDAAIGAVKVTKRGTILVGLATIGE